MSVIALQRAGALATAARRRASSATAPTVSIAGTVAHGQTLTASAVGATSYQWYAGASPIAGAVSSTYIVDRAKGGYSNGLTCRASNSAGTTISNALVWLPTTPGVTLAGDMNANVGVSESGGRITSVANQAGGVAFAAAYVGFRPVLAVGGGPNGLAAVDFASTNEFGRSLAADLGLGASVSVCVVAQTPAPGRYMHDGGTPDSRAIIHNASQLRMYAGLFGPSLAAPAAGTWVVHCAVFAGAASKQTISGGPAATGDAGTTSSTAITLGARADSVVSWCSLQRMTRALVYGGALSDAERQDVETYLREWAAL